MLVLVNPPSSLSRTMCGRFAATLHARLPRVPCAVVLWPRGRLLVGVPPSSASLLLACFWCPTLGFLSLCSRYAGPPVPCSSLAIVSAAGCKGRVCHGMPGSLLPTMSSMQSSLPDLLLGALFFAMVLARGPFWLGKGPVDGCALTVLSQPGMLPD